MNRSARIASLIERSSDDDLRRATLQAIDHAYKTSAEIAQISAVHEGAIGVIAQLQQENDRLRERISVLEEKRSAPARTGPLRAAGRRVRGVVRALRQRLRA